MRSTKQKVAFEDHWRTILEARQETPEAKAKAKERMEKLAAHHARALEKAKASLAEMSK